MQYNIQICCGTMCYILGGAELHSLKDSLPIELRDRVNIEGIPCLGKCNDQDAPIHPPCAFINGLYIPHASIDKIINQLQNL